MSSNDLLNSILQGTAAKNIRMIVARGAAPLPIRELLVTLVHLAGDKDTEVSGAAVTTIAGIPESEILAQIKQSGCSVVVLEYLAASSSSQSVLESIILNPSTPGAVVESLAERVPEALMEAVLYNRVRILESPGILGKLRLNPHLTQAVERLVGEIETEFFSGKRSDYAVSAPTEAAPEAEAPAEPVPPESAREEEEEGLPDDLILEGLPLDPDEREKALSERLSRMPVPQKIRFAMLGTREARTILIRDTNKEVARSVLKCPKISESEVQAFSAMRNIADELLRVIGENRQWTRNYTVVQNLVKNPKTPPTTSQHLITRLHSKDLVQLSRDRAVSEAVRRAAQRTVDQRNAKGR